MRWAIIDNGLVVNVAVADADYAAQQGWIECPDHVGPGFVYIDKVFSPAPRNIDAEWAFIRQERDRLLAESDTAVLPDRWSAMTQEKQQAWAVYRQSLRDIPQSYNDPRDVVWPTKP